MLIKLSAAKTALNPKARAFIFIVPPDPSVVSEILRIVKPFSETGTKPCIFGFLQGCDSDYASKLAKEKVVVRNLDLGLIPIENDVVSLELANGFYDSMIAPNELVKTVKNSVVTLEGLFGEIPLKFAKGKCACSVVDLLVLNPAVVPRVECEFTKSNIYAMVLIDRETDLVTPLLTQMTYEGLIDEFFWSHCRGGATRSRENYKLAE